MSSVTPELAAMIQQVGVIAGAQDAAAREQAYDQLEAMLAETPAIHFELDATANDARKIFPERFYTGKSSSSFERSF